MNRLIFPTSLLLAAVLASSAPAGIRIVRTGTNYATVQAAASAAIDGDTIEIDSGTYVGSNGNALFTRNNLTIRGVGATRPIMDAGYTSIQGKGIWLIQGTNTTVEFIEFRNCAVPDLNGAGIRQEGATLTVRDCYFHDNENGILGGAGDISDITIENCEFAYNGFGDGQSHQIYIGTARSLTVRYCYFHHGWKGQEIKSRAKANYILYNRITCEADGYSNYEVSLCQGGESYVIGNIIHQGPLTQNKVIIDYNSDGAVNPDLHLYVINNTVVNDSTVAASSIFVRVGLPTRLVTTPAVIQNNIFQGVATHAIVQYFTSTATYSHANWTNNWHTGSSSAYLAWPFMYDYRLTAASTGAIDMGVTPGTSHTGYSLTPTHQYVHPCSSQTRPTNGTIDIGAYEYVSSPANQAPYVDAGQDQITTPPRYTVNLDATIHDDTTASPTVYWSKVSGPGAVTFADANAVDTTATFGASGTYVLQLQATDGGGLYTTDTVTVTVNPDPALGGTITLQNGVAPDVTYVGCEDNWMTSGSPNTNYGTNDWGNGMGQYAGTRRSLIKFDVSAIPDTATVSAATIRLWMCKIQANRTLEAYQVLRPWTKLGSSWNNYASGLAWTVAGCDGAGTDRASTAAANVNVTTSQVGTWVEIPLPASLVQGWVDGTIDNYGVLLKVTSESSNEMRFWPENYVDRHGAIASRPQLVVTYDVGSPIDLRVDFGSNATNPSPNWNTVSTLVTDMAMVDYGSGSTSHGVTMTLSKTGSTINNGPTGSWNPIFPGPSWLDSSKYAVSDCLYGSWNTILYITFKNLNPSSTYTIEVVSSSSSDNDSVPWRVNGGTWTYWQAKGNGYDQGQWITWTDVTPDANNEIIIQASNSGSVNAFLNAIRLYGQGGSQGLPTVTLTANDPDASETGPATGHFIVSRGSRTDGDLVVYYTIGGTATNGTDYSSLSGSVTIPDGQTNATITVTPVDDSAAEGSETVVLTLSSDAAYAIGSPDSDTVIIVDNDVIDLRVDFGSNATNPSPNWNTVSTPVTDMTLVDYGSGSTSHGITLTFSKAGSLIYNGPTGSWNSNYPGPIWLDSSKYAASDCLYGAWNTNFYVTFKNLNPSSTYTIEVVSSSSSDNDSVPWRVNGGTWTYWQAKGNGYDQGQWITWTSVTPDANNEIVVQAGNSTQVNVFLNAVRLISE